MAVVKEKLNDRQIKILKQLKRKPHTSSEVAELLNKADSRRSGYAFRSKIHTYDSVHGALRRLEDREFVRRIMRHVAHRTPDVTAWELTNKGRDWIQ